MITKIENVILSQLVFNQEYSKRVIYYLKPELFTDIFSKEIFKIIFNYYKKYLECCNSIEVLLVEVDSCDFPQKEELKNIIKSFEKKNYVLDWLVQKTEEWASERTLYLALSECIDIADSKIEKPKSAIPEIIKNALSFSFDKSCGHDYEADCESRYEIYSSNENKIPFSIKEFNDITEGGVEPKTLNIIASSTGGGKTLFLCNLATSYFLRGLNVVYFTLELSENKISQRIDSNLLNIPINSIKKMSFHEYNKSLRKVLEKYNYGKLIVKEYPTSCANVNNFRSFLNELSIKKNIIPDIIIVDYLNICSSSRLKTFSSSGSYLTIKSIAEELRGLAVEYELPVWSATQFNRQSQKSEDPDLKDISESFGVAYTVDFAVAMIKTQHDNIVVIKQLKNRYGDMNFMNRFELMMDKSRMKILSYKNSGVEELGSIT